MNTKLTIEEIKKFIKNPLPPPLQFADRTQNGDYGLLPIEIWDKIYDIKSAMETKDYHDLKKKITESHVAIEQLTLDSRMFFLNNCNKTFHFKSIKMNWDDNYEVGERTYLGNKMKYQEKFIDFIYKNGRTTAAFGETVKKMIKYLNQKCPRKKSIEWFNGIMENIITDNQNRMAGLIQEHKNAVDVGGLNMNFLINEASMGYIWTDIDQKWINSITFNNQLDKLRELKEELQINQHEYCDYKNNDKTFKSKIYFNEHKMYSSTNY